MYIARRGAIPIPIACVYACTMQQCICSSVYSSQHMEISTLLYFGVKIILPIWFVHSFAHSALNIEICAHFITSMLVHFGGAHLYIIITWLQLTKAKEKKQQRIANGIKRVNGRVRWMKAHIKITIKISIAHNERWAHTDAQVRM